MAHVGPVPDLTLAFDTDATGVGKVTLAAIRRVQYDAERHG
jgi:hypothetical protein